MIRNQYIQDLVEYARQFLGRSYIYGSNGPDTFDCSGLMCFLLRREGLVGEKEDLSASGLYDKFKRSGQHQSAPYPSGTLLFYGRSQESITHVALVIDAYHVLECGGGNEKTDSTEKAKALGACVRERSIHHRSDVVRAVQPPYPFF